LLILSRQRVASVLLSLVPIGALLIFAWMHTGSRAIALCAEQGFSGTGSLSLWPPGARCIGGDPTIEKTMLHPAFFLLVAAITLALLGAAAIVCAPRAARPDQQPATSR
jgi:hypothetical protein